MNSTTPTCSLNISKEARLLRRSKLAQRRNRQLDIFTHTTLAHLSKNISSRTKRLNSEECILPLKSSDSCFSKRKKNHTYTTNASLVRLCTFGSVVDNFQHSHSLLDGNIAAINHTTENYRLRKHLIDVQRKNKFTYYVGNTSCFNESVRESIRQPMNKSITILMKMVQANMDLEEGVKVLYW
ncbi:hypothetical protein GIB67_039570 [Kingdonia uniflora]|uniref:Uncharacterized protein n=1 Tax=Kingdonia uniflora TaxID=39325 RepID=A0A7J7P6W7_9MAGN|nr:hypothetical protein GIB67_039570 [Kingdonia uniflora]